MPTGDDAAFVELFPGVRRLRAPNPGPMTGRGTNSYLIGERDLVLIDPGPEIPEHLERLVALGDGMVRYVVVTHTHRDHAPGAAWVTAATGATLLGFGARDGFVPAGELRDGDVVRVEGFTLEALHTPGHASNHLCYLLGAEAGLPGPMLFSGDHVMGGSTVVISPPDGDMAAYFASLKRLAARSPKISMIAPGHGGLLDHPGEVFAEYLAHRRAREESVRALLAQGPATPATLVDTIYPEISDGLRHAARQQLWAHLRKLGNDGLARTDDVDDPEATWSLSSTS